MNTFDLKEANSLRNKVIGRLRQEDPQLWLFHMRTLCEHSQRHCAKAFAGLGSVDHFNVEDDAVVLHGPVHANRFDQCNHVEKLLMRQVLTVRDSRGRLGIQIAVLAVQQRTESCVSHVHDRVDGSMNVLFLCVVADGNLRHREG